MAVTRSPCAFLRHATSVSSPFLPMDQVLQHGSGVGRQHGSGEAAAGLMETAESRTHNPRAPNALQNQRVLPPPASPYAAISVCGVHTALGGHQRQDVSLVQADGGHAARHRTRHVPLWPASGVGEQ